jgi:hypothetical protein
MGKAALAHAPGEGAVAVSGKTLKGQAQGLPWGASAGGGRRQGEDRLQRTRPRSQGGEERSSLEAIPRGAREGEQTAALGGSKHPAPLSAKSTQLGFKGREAAGQGLPSLRLGLTLTRFREGQLGPLSMEPAGLLEEPKQLAFGPKTLELGLRLEHHRQLERRGRAWAKHRRKQPF